MVLHAYRFASRQYETPNKVEQIEQKSGGQLLFFQKRRLKDAKILKRFTLKVTQEI